MDNKVNKKIEINNLKMKNKSPESLAAVYISHLENKRLLLKGTLTHGCPVKERIKARDKPP